MTCSGSDERNSRYSVALARFPFYLMDIRKQAGTACQSLGSKPAQ
jgi:hypothetical protein